MEYQENTRRALEESDIKKTGNLDGTARPSEDPHYAEYAEVNTKDGLTGNDMMSGVINSPDSNYQGWNGVDDIDASDYGDLTEIERILP